MASPVDDVKKHLEDPEYLRLAQEASDAMRRVDAAMDEIRAKFPLPEGMYWGMFGGYHIHPMHDTSSAEIE